MREYTIEKKKVPFDWSAVPALPIDCTLWSPAVPISAEARICYNDKALYICLSAIEPQIRAENTGLLEMPCEDSCLEFFFSPVPGDPRYFNIEFNPNGCMFLGFGSNRYDLVRLLPVDCPISPEIRRFDGGWEISYTIPCSFIQRFFPDFKPVSGGTIRANCYKCGDLTVQAHYMSWNPIVSEIPDFHCPAEFGLMRFA